MASSSSTPIDSLTLPSGRTLAWTVWGGSLDRDSDHPPVVAFYFHGLPGSHVEVRFFPEPLLQKYDLRLVGMDRPGMGGSTYYAGRRVLDWPADVLAVADHLRVDKFHIIGASGGGPYAMACTREIPRVKEDGTGRLLGVTNVCAIYPMSLGTKGMMLTTRSMFTIAAWLPIWASGFLMDRFLGSVARNPDPKATERHLEELFASQPGMGKEIWAREEIRSLLVDSMRESFRQSKEGNALEMKLVSDWGFGLEELDGTGVILWHGKKDVNVPFQMAEKAAKLMPAAKANFFEEENHMSLAVNHAEAIVADIVKDHVNPSS